jgi:hypothetical protein
MDTLLTTTDPSGRVHEVARARVFRLGVDGAVYVGGHLIARFVDDALLVSAAGEGLPNATFRALADSRLTAHLGSHSFTTDYFTLTREDSHGPQGIRVGHLACLRNVGGGLVAKANDFVWRDDYRKVKELFICDYDVDLTAPAPLTPPGRRSRVSPLAARL